jgi:hypothetical protein
MNISTDVIHECRGGMWDRKRFVETRYQCILGEIDGHNDGSFAWVGLVQWDLGRRSNYRPVFVKQ